MIKPCTYTSLYMVMWGGEASTLEKRLTFSDKSIIAPRRRVVVNILAPFRRHTNLLSTTDVERDIYYYDLPIIL